MADRMVIDASVLAAAFFNEDRSVEARQYLQGSPRLQAPELIRIEIASIAAKKIWKHESSHEAGIRAVIAIDEFVSRIVPTQSLAVRALELAASHRFSAYDATYLALAQAEGVAMVTFDDKLKRRAEEVGLTGLVISPRT